MARFLIQVQPDKLAQVQEALIGLRIRPVEKLLDYIVVDIPPELAGEIRALPYVVEVVPEEKVTLLVLTELINKLRPCFPCEGPPVPRFLIEKPKVQIPPEPMPVEKKLERFLELAKNPLTLVQAHIFAIAETRDRWLTGESRKLLGADLAEKEGVKGRGIKVAVIDTGGSPTMPGHYLSLSSRSAVEGQPVPWDENGHSTHVATTISGNAHRIPFGLLKGMGTDIEVGIFKALGYGIGAGTTTSVLRAMMDAFEWGASIINMSLGTTIGPTERHDIERCPQCRACRMLTAQGIIIVVAAGNDGEGYASCPGISPDVITVGAIDRNGNIASFSSRKHPQYIELGKPEVVAPGVYITSSTTGLIALMQAGKDWIGTASISGTSMAAPHVAGWVALVKELYRRYNIELTTPMVKDMLRRYGKPWTPEYGWGVPHWNMAKKR